MNHSSFMQKSSTMPTIQENMNLSVRSHKSVRSRLVKNNIFKNGTLLNPVSMIEKSNSPSFTFRNDCPGGDECRNMLQIKSLSSKIQQYKNTINDLSDLNNFFIYTLYQKDNMYRTLLKENTLIKHGTIIMRESQSEQLNDLIEKKNKSKISTTRTSFTAPISMNKSFFQQKLSQTSSQIISKFRKEQKQNNPKTFFNSHYEKISILSNKTSKHNMQSSSISFLSMSPEQIKALEHSEHFVLIQKYIKTDEDFINKIKSETRENLTSFCDSLQTLTKEITQMIRLLVRVKLFLICGNDIVLNMLSLSSKNLALDKTCHFLNCERATIYLYDHISDMLLVNSRDENDQNKIDKNKGIIGHVFTKGEKIKIDDTSIDPRFRQDFEGEFQNKTRNIVCYPLTNKKGNIFGVIEAVNKKDKHFDNDDDELMLIYSTLTSILIENTSNNDMFSRQVLKYEKLIKYSIEIQSIKNDLEFVNKTESFLKALFYSVNARLFWVRNDQLFYNHKEFPKKSNTGIVYYVIKKKKCYGCSKVKICPYYNSIVDIEASESLVTYPIMYDNDCIAITQVCIDEQIDSNNKRPHERELKLFNLIEICVISWYKTNNHSLKHY